MAKYSIDDLLEAPCWVVDILPKQVPDTADARYFETELFLLSGRRAQEVRRAFADVLVKLSCYFDFLVYRDFDDKGIENPPAKKLTKWITNDKGTVNVLIKSENALVNIPDMSTYMAVHNASPELLELISKLAAANGLFVWEAQN